MSGSGATVTLKLASSLDGRIATAAGESHWITGEAAREQVHRLRAEHDVVLVGVGTVLADDPALTVRLPGYGGAQPVRAVLDTSQRLPLSSRLLARPLSSPVWLFSAEAPRAELLDAGVRVERVGEGRPQPKAVLQALAQAGLRRVFVEGGGQVAASFLRAGLVDRLDWFRAPILLGDEGRAAVAGLTLARLADAIGFRRVAVEAVGDDLWERYARL